MSAPTSTRRVQRSERRWARVAIVAASIGLPGLVVLGLNVADRSPAPSGHGHGGEAHTTTHQVPLRQIGGPLSAPVAGGRGRVGLTLAAETRQPQAAVPAGAPLVVTVQTDRGLRGAPRLSARRLPQPGVVGGTVALGEAQTLMVNRTTGAVGVPPTPGGHAGHAAAPGLDATQSSTRGGALQWAATLPKGAADVQPSPDGRWLVAAYPESGRVELLDVLTHRPAGAIAVGGRPESLRFAPRGGRLWVGDPDSGQLSVVDLGARRVVGRVQAGAGRMSLAFDATGSRALAVSAGDGSATLIDARAARRLAGVPVGADPTGVAFAPRAGAFLIARGSGPLVALELAPGGAVRQARELPAVAQRARAVAVAPDGRNAVALAGSKMVVFDARTGRVRGKVAAGKAPSQLVFLERRFALALDAGSPNVTWLDLVDPTRSNEAPLGRAPGRSLTVSADGREAAVASPRDGWVYHLHVMMGRPMVMQQDRNPLGADTAIASRPGLVPVGAGRFQQRTVLTQPGRYRLAVALPGGGRAVFPVRVAPDTGGVRVLPARAHLLAREGEPVTASFDVNGAAPAAAEVVAYEASPQGGARQLRLPARRVAPGRYAATFPAPAAGRYQLTLLGERPTLPPGGAGATLVVRPRAR